MAETYNGWTNRPTWNANLWLANTESLYQCVETLADETPAAAFAAALQGFCARIWPNGKTPDGDALADVNWREIARNWRR